MSVEDIHVFLRTLIVEGYHSAYTYKITFSDIIALLGLIAVLAITHKLSQ